MMKKRQKQKALNKLESLKISIENANPDEVLKTMKDSIDSGDYLLWGRARKIPMMKICTEKFFEIS